MIPKELANMKPLKGNEKLERDSEYMGADDIDTGAEPVLTIKEIYRGKITLSRGKEVKNVLSFVEESVPGISEVRPLIVNSGNRQILKKLYKEVTANALRGKKIQLWIEHGVRNPQKGELGNGIRIRDMIPDGSGGKYVAPKCEECGKDVTGLSTFTAEQIAQMTRDKYGKTLCSDCASKAKAEMEAKEAEAAAKAEAEARAKDAEKKTETVTAEPEGEPQDDLAAQLMAAAGK